MMLPKSIDALVTWLLKAVGVHGLVVLRNRSALRDDGWFQSFDQSKSIDVRGQPVPWISYPARDFLEPRLRNDMTVFEFGAGASTFWWARHVKSVSSIEHDEAWHKLLSANRPANAEVKFHALEPADAYAESIFASRMAYDIVFIDGRHRVKCLAASVQALNPRGVVILDNSERWEYQQGIDHLCVLGFRKIEIQGMAPGIAYKTQSTIFYRDGNVLGI